MTVQFITYIFNHIVYFLFYVVLHYRQCIFWITRRKNFRGLYGAVDYATFFLPYIHLNILSLRERQVFFPPLCFSPV